MDTELKNFIEQAHSRGLDDDQIKQKLVAAGWDAAEVDRALSGQADTLAVPAPPPGHQTAVPATPAGDPIQPISVVQNLSVKGFEYNMMFITLWLSAIAAVWIIDDFIFNASTSINAFPLTVLLVSLPTFLIMFSRLRRAELADNSLRNDPSRRKSIQSTQRLAFIVLLVQTIGTLYAIIQHSDGVDIPKVLLSWVVSVVVFGGIFVYYWKGVQKEQSGQV